MRNLIVLAGILFIGLMMPGCKGGSNGKAPAAAVPESVINAFNSKYPGVNDVKWEQEHKGDTSIFDGDFTMNGKSMEARFDDQGNFINEK